MFLTRSEYDRGVNTFSPEGRLFQVEYALEAIKLGIGVQCEEGVVLAVEKRLTSPLLEPSSIQKVVEIDYHLICALSGLTADSRTIIDHARIETQNHRFNYDEPMGVESCVQSICDLALRFGENRSSGEERMSRPFGVALLIAGVDEKGPSLYYSDPSGTFTQFNAKAIGAGSEGAQTTLQEKYSKTLTLQECQKLALTTLKQVMEEAITTTNVEIAVITKAEGKFKIYDKEELAAVIATLTE
ncbi:proteasome subunit alpha type 5 [Dictyostelium purpureum]|uniref:Proteasome subunit alpha type n=1 Tax=Dictyostelium purpureum TaxID=5786 RepID=F0ZSD1_DICPU|nr:proteasome subunit alpha type 5 [Dictyostelium purpureum]EGC33140.1 proteasome subunit alpha type 5 [Dictyostelium purpureum]|eukprot:XP_003290335.1 proteasome subunit alpha type 5 [Dictyostelium purpureum]